ncbi:hypothetical protein [Lyngbya confervoides]|uniref:Uncharacterized protein n=1 Tax=Lyngbya confervoides BDU141951 TaxID=1574623 RepID=A0ABD4T039_9CYAN|nr:hypothetical protein [Lyngbya confervoides]MCM1981899.1 hypothetical protein [Lyngbya confervoides BDU141951]
MRGGLAADPESCTGQEHDGNDSRTHKDPQDIVTALTRLEYLSTLVIKGGEMTVISHCNVPQTDIKQLWPWEASLQLTY